MSDTSKRIELGSHTFFQLGTETVIPDDGNAYALIRSKDDRQAAKFVQVGADAEAAYSGNDPIKVNGHDIELLIDNQLLQLTPDGKLTVNLNEIGGELTDKLNIDLTNISEAGKAAILKLFNDEMDVTKDTITINDKLKTATGRTIALSSPDTNVITYGDEEAYLYFTSKQDLIHMKDGEAVHIVDSENFAEYTTEIVAALEELDNKVDQKVDTADIPSANKLLTGTAVNVTTLATNAELATVVQKVNELIARLEDRGVTKAK